MKKDEEYLNKCLELASKGKGRTNPNPLVGCVVVKNNKIIGKGYHKKAGGPHAERIALKQAGKEADKAVLYTNLEPCTHYGRTSPCTQKIIESGVSKVVYSMIDPNPMNNGKGVAELKSEGIEVKGGILKEKAQELNSVYIKYITKKLPYITIKVAQSLDGKIATSTGQCRWISGKQSREKVQELRNIIDAVAVGINTVMVDNPSLIPRLKEKQIKKVSRIVFDSKLRIPFNSKLMDRVEEFPLIIVTSSKIDLEKKNLLEERGVKVIISGNHKVQLLKAMEKLAKEEITHILVEGGGNIVASLLEGKLVDEVFCFIAPKIIGGRDAVTSVEGKGINDVNQAIELKNLSIERIEKDILVHGYIFG